MKTLTVTKAREKLGYWCKRAAAGESIGIIVGDKVIALREVPIEAADYAQQEYGLTSEELDRAVERIEKEARRAYDAGETVSAEEFLDEITGKARSSRAKTSPKARRRRKATAR